MCFTVKCHMSLKYVLIKFMECTYFKPIFGVIALYSSYKYIHCVRKKRGHIIFDHKSRISWWIFIILIPLETGTNTPQSYVIYLLDGLMTS